MRFMIVNGAASMDLYAVYLKEKEIDENGKTILNIFIHLTEVAVDDDHWLTFFPAASNAVFKLDDVEEVKANIITPDGADLKIEEGMVEEGGVTMTAYKIVQVICESTGN